MADEAKKDTFNTLDDLLQLLLINDEIINMGEGQRRQKNLKQSSNAVLNVFDLLSIVVNIAEQLMDFSERY